MSQRTPRPPQKEVRAKPTPRDALQLAFENLLQSSSVRLLTQHIIGEGRDLDIEAFAAHHGLSTKDPREKVFLDGKLRRELYPNVDDYRQRLERIREAAEFLFKELNDTRISAFLSVPSRKDEAFLSLENELALKRALPELVTTAQVKALKGDPDKTRIGPDGKPQSRRGRGRYHMGVEGDPSPQVHCALFVVAIHQDLDKTVQPASLRINRMCEALWVRACGNAHKDPLAWKPHLKEALALPDHPFLGRIRARPLS